MVFSLGKICRCILPEPQTEVSGRVKYLLNEMIAGYTNARPSMEEVLEMFRMWEADIDSDIAAGTSPQDDIVQSFNSKLKTRSNEDRVLSYTIDEYLGYQSPFEGYEMGLGISGEMELMLPKLRKYRSS